MNKAYEVYYEIEEHGKKKQDNVWWMTDSPEHAEEAIRDLLVKQHPDATIEVCKVVE